MAAAEQILIDEQAEWADKILVAHYVDEEEAVLAQNRLNLIPQNSPENEQFHLIYTALIDGLNGGSGKNAAHRANVEDLARDPFAKNHALAEAALALVDGKTYRRQPTAVNLKSSDTNSDRWMQARIYPNPVDGDWLQLINTSKDEEILYLMDIQGKILKEYKIIGNQRLDIRDIDSGSYLLVSKKGNWNQKVVIIK